MKKSLKMILIIVGVGIALTVFGICLFFSFGKNEKVDKPKKDDEEVVVKEGYDEFGNKLVVRYSSKEEVYDVIVNEYLRKGESITNVRVEENCWYYDISNGVEVYFYCVDDPIIRVIETQKVVVK